MTQPSCLGDCPRGMRVGRITVLDLAPLLAVPNLRMLGLTQTKHTAPAIVTTLRTRGVEIVQ